MSKKPTLAELKVLRKEFDDAFHTVNGHFGIMRKFGANVCPPSGELDAEAVVDIGISGSRAALRITNAFYTLLEYHKDEDDEVLLS